MKSWVHACPLYVRQQWQLNTSEKWIGFSGCLNIHQCKHSDIEGSHCPSSLTSCTTKPTESKCTIQNLALNKHCRLWILLLEKTLYSTAESGAAPCIMFPEYERIFKECFNKGYSFLSSSSSVLKKCEASQGISTSFISFLDQLAYWANKMAKPLLTSDHRDIHNLYVGINDNIPLSHQFVKPTWLSYPKAFQLLGLRITESILRY